MAATYDPTLPTDRDWIRLEISDTSTAAASFSDEELDAIIAEEPSNGTKACKYFAAAAALSILSAKWASGGKGISNIRVWSLDIQQGVSGPSFTGVETHIKRLRTKGAYYASGRRPVRAFGGRRLVI